MTFEEFPKNEYVIAFERDADALGPINDSKEWFITSEWASKFEKHLKLLLPIAKSGDVASQYAVALIYMFGYQYSSEMTAIDASEQDIIEATKWLQVCAKSGHLNALDNLLSVGVGKETERLRLLAKENENLFENHQAPSTGWLRNLKILYDLAYKQN